MTHDELEKHVLAQLDNWHGRIATILEELDDIVAEISKTERLFTPEDEAQI